MTAKAKYTAQVIGMVEPSLKDLIKDFADQNGLSASEVVRRAIIAGLPTLANPPGPEQTIGQSIQRSVLKDSNYFQFGFQTPEVR